VLLPRHRQQEVIAMLNACCELVPMVQRIVRNVTDLALTPELLQLRRTVIRDATEAIEKTLILSEQLDALSTSVAHLEPLKVN
jgi:hypothetical protein